ncbi:hypothetical protein CC80DRAFT_531444 [Byssothecium circinans]|uniref:Apple domain-containing protein n=1 Tax=Byssothecium circinans TaxID=147558 RepID=A0A6A5U9M7_9PLEO|nr:hypothetical protein CC80DRAFT_531444 [Byssothecium circinans]
MASSECRNGTTVTSLKGLNYTLYCDYDIPASDRDVSMLETFSECLDKCTRTRPLCWSVVWDPEIKRCTQRLATLRHADLVAGKTDLWSAVVYASQVTQKVSDQACPYPNLSTHTTRTGMEFRIACGAYVPTDVLEMIHTETMDGCMDQCAAHHPLCNAISFNSDPIGSDFLNCVIKNSTGNEYFTAYTRTLAHSAVMVEYPREKTKCENDSIKSSRDGRRFKTSCYDFRGFHDPRVPPILNSHENNLGDCLQRCANANSTCNAVSFDAGLQQGFQKLLRLRATSKTRHAQFR